MTQIQNKTEKAEKKRQMHAKLFGYTKRAIENEYYFEALVFEYASIEERTKRIMKSLNMICYMPKMYKDQPYIGLTSILTCLESFTKDETIFKDSKFGATRVARKETIEKVKDWIDKRNLMIHQLYASPDGYEKILKHAAQLAAEGYDHVDLFHREATRIKNLLSKNPDLLKRSNIRCQNKEKCKKLRDFLQNLNKQ